MSKGDIVWSSCLSEIWICCVQIKIWQLLSIEWLITSTLPYSITKEYVVTVIVSR